jgi:hypothetical protein
MRRKRRSFEIFSLSFLDVVSCGFGAIVLLLVIVKISEPLVVEQANADLSSGILKLIKEQENLVVRSTNLSSELSERSHQKLLLEERIASLQKENTALKKQQQSALVTKASKEVIVKQLYRAKQELTEEMARLQQTKQPKKFNSVIGGVPVDSEYIIFVIDTSGSMQQFAWNAVRKKMKEILEIYPQVKGIQVMNDMGDYMFSQYKGKWIMDTPARRNAILQRLTNWMPFSNSSPVEGISAAIKRFYSTDKKISIYILGDDFSRGSIQSVVDTVSSINRSQADGSRRVRIHAVGFPVLFGQPGAEINIARFAALMRRLAEDNDGSFVGLSSLK